MSTKLDLVNDCYSQLRISGLTVDPTPSDLQLALYRMERMMAELYEQREINIGYNFTEYPALGDQSGISLGSFLMVSSNTAVRLAQDFGKDVAPTLARTAAAAMSGVSGQSALNNMRQIQPPFRMPLGNGNTFRWLFWNRYAVPVANAPVGAATNYMLQGETLSFTEDFSAWLQGATIVSYEILVDPLLTIVTDSNDSPLISYTLTAPVQPATTNGPYQLVLISVTDSRGLTDIRLVNFQVATPPDVGSNT